MLSKQKIKQKVPDCLEGETTKEGIIEKFRELYSELYNSANTSNEVLVVKERFKNMSEQCSKVEVNKINNDIVTQACNRIKAGKSDVTEAYSSDIFINAPNIMMDKLADIFKSYLFHGNVSEIILGCAFLPLFKGGFKKPDQFSSYRAIAGSSQLLKLFEYVILIIWGQNLKSDSLQFGFKEKCSTTHCTWIVNEVCGYFNRRNTDMYITLLDCTKAFDLCKFSDLFMKLSEKLDCSKMFTFNL